VSRILRNASYVLVATIVASTIAGCGGSSVSHGASSGVVSTGNATTGLTGPQTNLASIGYIEVSYLTGAGRAATRDYGDVVMNITLGDWIDDEGNLVSAPTGTSLNLQADAYGGPQVVRTPVTFGASTSANTPNTSPDSRLFRNYTFTFNYLTTNLLPGQQILPSQTFVVTNGNMASDELSANALGDGTTFSAQTYQSYVRSFPGRFSSVTVRIDPNTIGLNFVPFTDNNGFQWGPSTPRGIFETTEFNTINANQTSSGNMFQSVLSDYLSFNISAMPAAALPSLNNNGISVNGQRVFFSGDT